MRNESARTTHVMAALDRIWAAARRTSRTLALLVLCAPGLTPCGCVHWNDCGEAPPLDVMPPVTFPDCTYYGLYPTCWRQWPPGWNCCPPPDQYLYEMPPHAVPVESLPSPGAPTRPPILPPGADSPAPAESLEMEGNGETANRMDSNAVRSVSHFSPTFSAPGERIPTSAMHHAEHTPHIPTATDTLRSTGDANATTLNAVVPAGARGPPGRASLSRLPPVSVN